MPDLASEPALKLEAGNTVLRVVLVNSMADAALAVTEQRFARLLRAAVPAMPIVLQCVTPPQIARGEMAAARIARHYARIDDVFNRPPDAVIFSGAEPRSENLNGEVFWPCLSELFDWVRRENIPALFSCLAAHAAVLYYSGVPRRRLARKAFGVFPQSPAGDHRLLRGVGHGFGAAHSRWNEIRAADLAECGYRVLTSGPSTEVDFFAPETGSQLVFLQGHPEYETSALDGEYRRDLRRYHAGESAVRPDMPLYAMLECWPPESGSGNGGMASFAPVIRNWIASRQELAA